MHFSHLDQWFSVRVILPPWGHLATTPGDIFIVVTRGGKLQVLAFRRYRPGMLLNFLQYPGQHPPKKTCWAPKIKSTEVEHLL